MSQNKTRIQGLDPVAPNSYSQEQPSAMPGNHFYQRSERPGARSTIVPGMVNNARAQNPSVEPDYTPHQPKSSSVISGKPVVGFLYSVSRTAAGEFWPLHIGQNSIGQSASCSIRLPEGTVSGEHAVLVVRKMKNPEGVIASIVDARSTNGTMLNGTSLGFQPVECKNGDIITIGDNYELLLMLVDVVALGLKESENFIAVENNEEDEWEEVPVFEPGRTRDSGSNSYYDSSYDGTAPGTVGLDGNQGPNRGGTVGM